MAAIASVSFSILTTSVGAVLWVRQKTEISKAEEALRASERARQEVNSERNFAHLVKNYEQMSQGLTLLSDEVREVKHELSEIKTLLISAKVIDRRGVSPGDSV